MTPTQDREIVPVDAASVILHLEQIQPAILNQDRDARGAGIDRIVQQLQHSVRWPLNDFPRRDAVRDVGVQGMDPSTGAHRRGILRDPQLRERGGTLNSPSFADEYPQALLICFIFVYTISMEDESAYEWFCEQYDGNEIAQGLLKKNI